MSSKILALGIAAGASSILTACGSGADAQGSGSTQNAADNQQEIEGYAGIKFGTSLNEALASLEVRLFNPASLNECLKDLPLKGCFLSGDREAAPFQIKDGIPYRITLSFNRLDKLTDVDLNYDRDGDISRDQCLEMHERTLDWMVREYGTMRASFSQEGPDEARTTPAKNSYYVGSEKDGFLVTRPMRTAAKAEPNVANQPITKWDNRRYASLLTHFIVVDGKPMCGVNVSFSEPESVERRKD
ncbi:MAG: hypothetical protein B7X90_14970 [Novosphingobium sp. 17-62-19]|uniref:hypothetical protein n=1 Tax=Novosphingobium sp. 17-62-19 TaxID=1970406 RepID=UPI000BD23D70|nr:hypothetical protein [Novosphingobium sp. 17-62-19]OZA17423.1 MAG: hypothetical protein B7X90_14970 [Novosphingobium sp. 17-62-19]OZA72351.1 MAG: hypothetical protein B7X78_01375 [Sphingomonadales bacterium 39-62-4]HQS98606.1 hypothetical protein [Novosphingobium sp.]